MIKMIISPAKTLDFEDKINITAKTDPVFCKEAGQIVQNLKKLTVKDLEKLMSISPKLATLNKERFSNFNKQPKRQALLAYRGDVYQGFTLDSYTKADYTFSQKNLRIISGLYGILRPLDEIQAYRLEMSTLVKIGKAKDLYQFWKQNITEWLIKDLKKDKIDYLLNLASNEYAKAIDFKSLPCPTIDVDFKVNKSGKLQTIGIFAKKARGLMADFVVKGKLTKLEQIKKFSCDGYRYEGSLSDSNKIIFVKKIS